jgi:hypothetical protein
MYRATFTGNGAYCYANAPGWNPEKGLDDAIPALGWTCERQFGDEHETVEYSTTRRHRPPDRAAAHRNGDYPVLRHRPNVSHTTLSASHVCASLRINWNKELPTG